jgi:hypothetical protein
MFATELKKRLGGVLMRAFRFSVVVILSMLVGCSALVYAQDDKSQEEKPRQEEAKPEPKQDEAKPPKPEKQEEKQKQEQKDSHGQVKSEQQAGHARPAGKGGHIPDDKFRAHFGRAHTFTAKTVIVSNQRQFQYSGYTFEFVDPWPQGWAYTDECYIDYIDGEYFLFDLLHPGVRIVVFVVM